MLLAIALVAPNILDPKRLKQPHLQTACLHYIISWLQLSNIFQIGSSKFCERPTTITPTELTKTRIRFENTISRTKILSAM